MKKIKFIYLSLIFIFISCSNNDENKSNEVAQSLATRVYLNAMKGSVGSLEFNSSSPNTLGCTPIFPFQVIYSNGSKVAINSMEDLKEAVYNENSSIHISSFIFPFSVSLSSNSDILIINNENDFQSLLFTIDSIITLEDYLSSTNCFEFVYPLSIVNNEGETTTIANQGSLAAILNAVSTNEYWVDFVYPFQIAYNGELVQIQNVWDFYNYVDCNPDGSYCTFDFNPTCVQTQNGVIQFDNPCWAIQAGHSEDDFVNCNSCECTEEFMPVCVQTQHGIVQFENSCWAACAGYTSEDFVSCD